ncbi:MAG: AfsR/SARP family transcriptional regulator, partial [Burkholderiaceae bacterium]
MHLQCFVLGEFKVLRDGVLITDWRRPSVVRLFKLLLASPGHTLSTEEVCNAFWPGLDAPGKARQRLHHQVYLLNQVLGADAAARPVQLSGTALRLCGYEALWLDAQQFELAMDAACAAPHDTHALEQALALYRVLLPDDMDDAALEQQRSHLAQRHANGLHALAQAHLRAGNQLAAVNALQRILQHLPAEESAHRALIELYGRAGQLAQADNQFAQCKQALMRAFACVPSEATLRAYRQAMQSVQDAAPPVASIASSLSVRPAQTAGKTEAGEVRFYAPAPVVQLVGRDVLIARYSRQLTEGTWRLFTLLGVGGVGKTQLAIRLAHELSGKFRHGTCFVALAEVGNAGVPERIARALGVREQPHRPLPELIAQFLRDKHLLLVLDNFEHVSPSVELLTPLLQACPLLTILCTSRIRLNAVAECVLEVPPLSAQAQPGTVNAAMELFVQRAAAVQPQFSMASGDSADVQAIVQALDGLPLALELAAARLPMYGLRGLRQALAHDQERVVAGGGQDRPQRHRSLAASMDWSFALLDAGQQRALHALALFAEPFDAQAADAVCASAVQDVAHALRVLVEAGLVSPQPVQSGDAPIYGLHSLTREFLAQRRRDAQEQQADARAFVAYLCGLAETLHARLEKGEVASAMRGFSAHHTGFFNALELADAAGDVQNVVKMVRHLALYWARAGAYSNTLRWVLRARAAAEVLPMDERGYLVLVLGYYFVSSANPSEANACAQQAIACAQNTGDQQLHARASLLLSGTVVALGSPASGIEVLTQARQYALAKQNHELLQKIRINLGVCQLQSGDLQAAHAEWTTCDALFKHHKTQARVSAISNLALLAQYMGRPRRAQRLS